MNNQRVMGIINISLILISFIFLINLFGFDFSSTGKAFYDIADPSEGTCFVEWGGEYSQMNMGYCCHDVQKQFSCEDNKQTILGEKTDISCQTGEGKVLKYHLNNKAFRACRGTVTWANG